MPRIVIVGAGVVGTAAGHGFALHRNDITYVDIDAVRLSQLRHDGYDARLPNNLDANNADIIMVAVPTPTNGSGLDFSYLNAATGAIGAALALLRMEHYPIVAYRSTMLPGSTRTRLIPLLEKSSKKSCGIDFGVCYMPEYIRELSAESDFLTPPTVLLGIDPLDRTARDVVCDLYATFAATVVTTTWEAAEFQKYVHNCVNAAKISFFNEMRDAGRRVGLSRAEIDLAFSVTVMSAEGLRSPAYGTKDLGPYAGSCLPKDVAASLLFFRELGVSMPLLTAVDEVNRNMANRKTPTNPGTRPRILSGKSDH